MNEPQTHQPSEIAPGQRSEIEEGHRPEVWAELPPEIEADLVALADGNLSPVRRLEVEAQVAGDPALAAALEQQRAALSLLSELTQPAPLELRQRVCQLRRRRYRIRLRRWLPVGFVATATATAALMLLLAGGAPAVDDVVAVALKPATAQPAGTEQLDGLRFPQRDDWRAVGVRDDEVDGRATRTVFYERDGKRIAYTIVAGPPLDKEPRQLRTRDGRAVIEWVRDGHTCVISGDIDPALLAKARAWR
jgi:anti-sigma factor RsiW